MLIFENDPPVYPGLEVPLLFSELNQTIELLLVVVAVFKAIGVFSQIVTSGPAFTVGWGAIVTVTIWETKPVQGAKFVAWSVKLTTPVSFNPGVYSGFSVFNVEGTIDPVPFSVHKNVE